ncbi:hypothetical protein N7532_007779 [Penicillium argentinense]|uniref:DUF1996 domain-containing protein n=1 Tax=Penicillium argentinense TaxID=1131581 RepID=A0A9W9EWD8_9EURO|nr:uncharacterized protein N7532_007779 [Penicillium argentinense]KAJ5089095.1 hypothetical protein N7532_007779 [Penicillium argentinense]
MQDYRRMAALLAYFAIFPSVANAFWRLPCRGRTGVARLDPIVDPGQISGHVHAIHGGGNFGMSTDFQSLRESSCTSCGVTQDMSAYWTPALYFMHTDGTAELVPEVGGMLAYYFLNKVGDEKIHAFPDGFRMLAGDPFQRNFTWPVPDPPKSSWGSADESQPALRQKAIGFNCLNYATAAEATLDRHYMPNKTFLDEHCTDGIRLELMFPQCWNGEDLDSDDHKSHVAYPSTVMDGECPIGYKTRLPGLMYETIWNTYAFKDKDGYFTLANGDPTGYGYHGDFMTGWEPGVLQEAVDKCTSLTGEVEMCSVFNLQSQTKQQQCLLEEPAALKYENTHLDTNGIPGNMPIQWGPEYATMSMPMITTSAVPAIPSLSIPSLSLSLGISVDGNVLGNAAMMATNEAVTTTAAATTTSSSTSTSTPTPTPTPTTSIAIDPITEEVVYLQRDIIVMIDAKGVPYSTVTGTPRTMSTSMSTLTQTSTVVSYVERDTIPEDAQPEDSEGERIAAHTRRHLHHHGRLHKKHGF